MADAEEYANSINAQVMRTSAKTSQGINEMFDYGACGDHAYPGLVLNDPKQKKWCCNLIKYSIDQNLSDLILNRFYYYCFVIKN